MATHHTTDHAPRGSEADRRHSGWPGIVLGFAPIVPMIAAAILVPFVVDPWRSLGTTLAGLWGAAILAFVAGVRRGISFETPGGPTTGAIAAALGFFTIAFVSLLLQIVPALILLAIGYAAIAVVDGRAAGRADVPRYFGTLRPVQMTLATIALGALAAGL